MEQLQAYADFVTKIAKTTAEYQNEAVGADGSSEQDRRAFDYIKQVLGYSDTDLGTDPDDEKALPVSDEKATALPEHFLGITVTDPSDKKDYTIDHFITGDAGTKTIKYGALKKFVITKLKGAAKVSYDLIKTILKIGMQKVVVTNGEIHTRLTFHVDATDTYSKTSSDYRRNATSWGVRGEISGGYGSGGGTIGGLVRVMSGAFIGGGVSGGYGSSELKVSVINEKSTAATNVNVDILGEVRIMFRTDIFPAVEG